MVVEMTAEEVRRECIERMGAPLGAVYFALRNELFAVWLRWNEFELLFGASPERVESLNRAAGSFFKMVQDLLWESSLLHVARITDSPKTMNKSNLTIQCLPDLVSDEKRDAVQELVEKAKDKAAFCKDWRNRRIAHKDRNLATSDDAQPLPEATRKKVREALEAIAEVLNAVALLYRGGSTLFECVDSLSGARSLLRVLEEGLKVHEDRAHGRSD